MPGVGEAMATRGDKANSDEARANFIIEYMGIEGGGFRWR